MSEDEFSHFGVKGMKWGVRRERPSADAIRSARKRVRAKKDAIEVQKDRVGAEKKGTKQRATQEKKLSDMKASFLRNPDRATAARRTRGEFWATQALAGGAIFLTGGAAIPVAAGVAATLGPVARRKYLESKTGSRK